MKGQQFDCYNAHRYFPLHILLCNIQTKAYCIVFSYNNNVHVDTNTLFKHHTMYACIYFYLSLVYQSCTCKTKMSCCVDCVQFSTNVLSCSYMKLKSISMRYSDVFREQGTTLIFPHPRIGSIVTHDVLLNVSLIMETEAYNRVQTMQLTAPINSASRN